METKGIFQILDVQSYEKTSNSIMETNIRQSELFGKRLRLSNENINILLAMEQLRLKKKKQEIEDEIEVALNKIRYQ